MPDLNCPLYSSQTEELTGEVALKMGNTVPKLE